MRLQQIFSVPFRSTSLQNAAVLLSACATTLLAPSVPAFAHGFAGNRFFPATLATDDPFVASELSLLTFPAIRQPGAPQQKHLTCQRT
jgi:hypothetical protein